MKPCSHHTVHTSSCWPHRLRALQQGQEQQEALQQEQVQVLHAALLPVLVGALQGQPLLGVPSVLVPVLVDVLLVLALLGVLLAPPLLLLVGALLVLALLGVVPLSTEPVLRDVLFVVVVLLGEQRHVLAGPTSVVQVVQLLLPPVPVVQALLLAWGLRCQAGAHLLEQVVAVLGALPLPLPEQGWRSPVGRGLPGLAAEAPLQVVRQEVQQHLAGGRSAGTWADLAGRAHVERWRCG
mmetsp:Transcript_13391/g.28639  ORF Transcript_13391/g.28639 Transcript_13391/m.28639 type:complete len:238 (+) Transcript_13391:548-1261(+)